MIDTEIANLLHEELTRAINQEFVVGMMALNGWYAVQIKSSYDDEELQEWVNENFKYKSMGYNGLWAFENKEEYLEFILRFTN